MSRNYILPLPLGTSMAVAGHLFYFYLTCDFRVFFLAAYERWERQAAITRSWPLCSISAPHSIILTPHFAVDNCRWNSIINELQSCFFHFAVYVEMSSSVGSYFVLKYMFTVFHSDGQISWRITRVRFCCTGWCQIMKEVCLHTEVTN